MTSERKRCEVNSVKRYSFIVSRAFVSRGAIYSLITDYSGSAYITRARNLLTEGNKAISLIYPRPSRFSPRLSLSHGRA